MNKTSILIAFFGCIAVAGCSAVNPYIAGVEAKGATDYQGAKANLQTADDMAFMVWTDSACNIKLGALKRNATGNPAAVTAVLQACPIPSPKKTVAPSDIVETPVAQ